jgi:hypothetical protein
MSGIVIDETKPGQAKYIDSHSKKWYRSDVPEGSMPLKARLIAGGSARRQNHHSDNQRRPGQLARHKLSDKEKRELPFQEKMVMVAEVSKGTNRMMTATDFAALSWGWEIS